VVVRALSRPPADVDALLETMATLRRAVGGAWGLGRLQALLGSVLDDARRAELLGQVVPTLCELVLETPRHFRAPLRLLRSGGPGSVELSAEQCACLLANAFFCTMPNRNDTPRGRGGRGSSVLPYFSFCWLIGEMPNPSRHGAPPSLPSQHEAKWLCLLEYFGAVARRRRDAASAGWRLRPVTFRRLVLDTSELSLGGHGEEAWGMSDAPLCPVEALQGGTIEDSGPHFTQLDFANATIGGGVLRNGAVQEEIRFLICPELIVSRAIAEPMAPHEALLMRGFERFSNYSGYGHATFAFAGPHVAAAGPPAETELLAIDAIAFGRDAQTRLGQYSRSAIERELNKAFVGFAPPDGETPDAPFRPLCTGNWGCGAFGGCVQLKAVVQWLAASRARRPSLRYLTFGDASLARALTTLKEVLPTDTRVGQVAKLLASFGPPHAKRRPPTMPGACTDLFGYLADQLARRPPPQRETAPANAPRMVDLPPGSDTEEEDMEVEPPLPAPPPPAAPAPAPAPAPRGWRPGPDLLSMLD